jgi:hypothetical protein
MLNFTKFKVPTKLSTFIRDKRDLHYHLVLLCKQQTYEGH